jgi:hypothetical protein
LLSATVVSGTTTGNAIEIVMKALSSGAQPALRTLIELSSCPSLERLSVVGALRHNT